MKKILLVASFILGVNLASTSTASAHDHEGGHEGGHDRGHGHGDFDLNFDFGGYYPGYYPEWCSRPVYYSSPVYYGPAPTVVYAQPPVVYSQSAPAPVQTTHATSPAPYGYLVSQGVAKSPWSDFSISTGGKVSGQVVYDANNGKPFRIP